MAKSKPRMVNSFTSGRGTTRRYTTDHRAVPLNYSKGSSQIQFLGLPAEIRNLIYSFTLSEQNPVLLLNGSIPQQPSLTRTCKRIRYETLPLYYSINKFHVIIYDYDVKFWFDWEDTIGLWHVRLADPFVCMPPNSWTTIEDPVEAVMKKATGWKNLMNWLEKFYCGQWRPIVLDLSALIENPTTKERSLAAVFVLARQLSLIGLNWAQAKPCLILALDMAESQSLDCKLHPSYEIYEEMPVLGR